MHITELRVGVSKTVNLGNFNSIRVEAGATASVDEGDDIAAARSDLMAECKASLTEQWQQFRRTE